MANDKCRILCVDDHNDSSEILGILLQEDYEVVTALSMEKAIELGRESTFDLYVLDKRLPDGSGLDLCRKLQELTPGVPCIFYTGDAYEVHRQEAIEAGAEAYIAKPNIDALIKTVHSLLSGTECAESAKP